MDIIERVSMLESAANELGYAMMYLTGRKPEYNDKANEHIETFWVLMDRLKNSEVTK